MTDLSTLLTDALTDASKEWRQREAARWASRACDKVLLEHLAMGFEGFSVTRGPDGLVFTGLGPVPQYLRSKETEAA